MDHKQDEREAEAIREIRKAIERSNQTLREVDDWYFWQGIRFIARILAYIASCLLATWFLFCR